jgi:hypothetical protein
VRRERLQDRLKKNESGCFKCLAQRYFLGQSWKFGERNVDVEITLSNPGSIPEDSKATEACYGNGWTCVDVASEITGLFKEPC